MASLLTARLADPRVETSPSDRYFDYCLQPYEPRRSPRGGLRGETLFWHSLSQAQATEFVYETALAIQESAGSDATVWGTKWIDGRLQWELYFYDPQRETPAVWCSNLARTLASRLTFAPTLTDAIPYFMWSFDLVPSLTKGATIELVNAYLSEPIGQAGRSYRVTREGFELDNHYVFLRPKEDIAEVLTRMKSSVFVDFKRAPLQRVLLPELLPCRRVCVAKKRRADSVYYSGLSVDQLVWFLQRFSYPKALVAFVEQQQQRLGHLSFDVGIDYRASADGTSIEVLKTGYYSTL